MTTIRATALCVGSTISVTPGQLWAQLKNRVVPYEMAWKAENPLVDMGCIDKIEVDVHRVAAVTKYGQALIEIRHSKDGSDGSVLYLLPGELVTLKEDRKKPQNDNNRRKRARALPVNARQARRQDH